jgi:hypothetical protein
VEAWKTPIACLQGSVTLAYSNSGVAFPTTSKTLSVQDAEEEKK